MSEKEPDDEGLIRTSDWGILIGLLGIALMLGLSKYIGQDKSFIETGIAGSFALVILIYKSTRTNIRYIATILAIFLIETCLVFFFRVPKIPSPSIAVLPIFMLNVFLTVGILRGVQKIFSLPKWNE